MDLIRTPTQLHSPPSKKKKPFSALDRFRSTSNPPVSGFRNGWQAESQRLQQLEASSQPVSLQAASVSVTKGSGTYLETYGSRCN